MFRKDCQFMATIHGFAGDKIRNAAAYEPEIDRPYIVDELMRPGNTGLLCAEPAVGKTATMAMICS